MMLCCMNGIFHLLVLVAAGEMLCPFRRKKLDTSGEAEGREASASWAGIEFGRAVGDRMVVEGAVTSRLGPL